MDKIQINLQFLAGMDMTNDEIMREIGQAAIERKECLDRVSCYEKRLRDAAHNLRRLLESSTKPMKEDDKRFLHTETDPRADAQAYVEAMTRAEELEAFLRKHNAL